MPFKVRREPTDISKLYFLDPALNDYVEVPYRDYARPSISLWEFRAAEAWLRRQGRAAQDEQAIFDAYEEMHRITTAAAERTKRARREHAKQREKRAGIAPNSPYRRPDQQQTSPNGAGHRRSTWPWWWTMPTRCRPRHLPAERRSDDSEIQTGVKE